MTLTKDQEIIVDNLLKSLVAYIDEFDNNEKFQKETTESGGVTPHVAKELHDNIKREFKISGKDYGSDMCCFSESVINSLNKSPFRFINELLELMGKDILTQQSIASELAVLNNSSWELIKKLGITEVENPVNPSYDGLGDLKTVRPSNVCWNSIIRYNDNYLVIEYKDGNTYIYKKSNMSNFSTRLRRCFSQSDHLYYLGVKEYKNQDKLFDLIGPFNTYKEYDEASNKLPIGMYGITFIVAKDPVDKIPDNIKKILAKNNVHCWSDFVKLSNDDQNKLRRECGHGSDLFNQFDHMLEDTGNKITW